MMIMIMIMMMMIIMMIMMMIMMINWASFNVRSFNPIRCGDLET